MYVHDYIKSKVFFFDSDVNKKFIRFWHLNQKFNFYFDIVV